MANDSMASGTIHLKGRWIKGVLADFYPVLEMWKFYGAYGLHARQKPTLENRTVEFTGCGRWSFSGTLSDFDSWTRSWLNSEEEGRPKRALTAEVYDRFLRAMEERKLKIVFDFEDREPGAGILNHEVGAFSSDGAKLFYTQLSCEYIVGGDDDLERATDYLARFLKTPDREALEEWIAEHIVCTHLFALHYDDNYSEVIYDLEEMMEEDPFPAFCAAFSPDTREWEDFCEEYEEIKGNRPDGREARSMCWDRASFVV